MGRASPSSLTVFGGKGAPPVIDHTEQKVRFAEVESENGRSFDAWLDDFFAAYYRRRPIDATFVGLHHLDDLLPDYSDDGRRAAVSTMRSLLDRLAELPSDGL